jgi:uncharacterized protein (TIGR00290 family)
MTESPPSIDQKDISLTGNNTAFMNWSGGKDSALCLYKIQQSKTVQIAALLTSMNSTHNRISMHGVRRALLEAQARSMNIPLHTIELPEQPDMQAYEAHMNPKLEFLRQRGCRSAVFGDIFLEDLKKYREEKLKACGMDCIFPLWKKDTSSLVKEFLSLGFKSIIVCVNEEVLDKSFCGRVIDENFLADLPPQVDPCGENGEFHSFVFEGPLFSNPVRYTKGEIVYKKYEAPKKEKSDGLPESASQPYGFYFCDLIPDP